MYVNLTFSCKRFVQEEEVILFDYLNLMSLRVCNCCLSDEKNYLVRICRKWFVGGVAMMNYFSKIMSRSHYYVILLL